jgi:Ni/Fe-hydrogenase subunit HybB-like protein
MHQSSLGSLMLLAGSRLHPLWHTPLLPLLFLVSCVGMGYAVVTVESTLSARAFRLPSETKMLRGLAGPAGFVLLAYAVVRGVDVVLRGKLELVTRMDGFSQLFLTEIGLFVLAGLGLLAFGRIARTGVLFTIAVAVILAGSLYRFSTYLIAFDPGPQWSYFPAIPEFAVTIGLVAGEILGYILLVKRFPVLRGAPRTGAAAVDNAATVHTASVSAQDSATVPVAAGDNAWNAPVVNPTEELIHAPDEP